MEQSQGRAFGGHCLCGGLAARTDQSGRGGCCCAQAWCGPGVGDCDCHWVQLTDPPISSSRPQQIARLRSELDIVRGNTKVMSEMLTEMVPGQEDSSDLELLQVRGPPLVGALGPGVQQREGPSPFGPIPSFTLPRNGQRPLQAVSAISPY